MALPLGAASLYTNSTRTSITDWLNDGAWGTSGTAGVNYLPGATVSDAPVIGRYAAETITLSGNANAGTGSIGTVNVAPSNGYASTLQLLTGAYLETTASVHIGPSSAAGTLDISGGQLRVNTAGTGYLDIGIASGGSSASKLILSGDADVQIGGRLIAGNATGETATVEVVGSNVSFYAGVSGGSTIELRATSLLKFIADAAGVSTLNTTGGLDIKAGATLSLDLSAYTGGTQTFVLLNGGANAASATSYFTTDTLDAIVAAATYDTSAYSLALAYDASAYDLKLTVTAVPEPAQTAAILGLLTLSIFARKRRKFRN
ncbi:MAG: PEP-CTERM sorting domain-containing protein [Opitutaceae bacterium]|nr:PEP-CTERM sorting domain-containing protein [Opitutaceae bacterium]